MQRLDIGWKWARPARFSPDPAYEGKTTHLLDCLRLAATLKIIEDVPLCTRMGISIAALKHGRESAAGLAAKPVDGLR